MSRVMYFDEPQLMFRHGQALEDPRDGLTLFGPVDGVDKPEGIRWGAVGRAAGIEMLSSWMDRIQSPVFDPKEALAYPTFPGFEAAFRTKMGVAPSLAIHLEESEIHRCAHNPDRHQRVASTVDLYTNAIIQALDREEVTPDVWCLVVPEYVYLNCRPQSVVPLAAQTERDRDMDARRASTRVGGEFLFEEERVKALPYDYVADFHHQIKAKLLSRQKSTQLIREPKIAEVEYRDMAGERKLIAESQRNPIAWSLSTALYYKTGTRPWKLNAARAGVCYVGLVFKLDDLGARQGTACCAAQMFLDSGDGVVFKGAVGPWYQKRRGEFHLHRAAAQSVVSMCVEEYQRKTGVPPKEVFIHGKVRFADEEWEGFLEGAGSGTNVVGVRIRDVYDLKLFRLGKYPILRGTALLLDDRKGYLWTRGMTPRIRTYPGREVPNPLLIDVCRGHADLEVVMSDVLALTKLNYNSCKHSDGLPVTLRFADAVGEILTAGPARDLAVPPLPFKYYL